ncbi:hypothetical protein GALMADRAFT_637611 [Galerina marginata CBS 339.88]|uniref:Uncharacterized protein n=1 Tax=Galerina marginata (strain CBS 339.88) TaxID=685588 RepID=A0A067TJG3_GALM3|nr:hypothetical protein GALMADRAFT_637611 [Galerina marginata CBS 339.88]
MIMLLRVKAMYGKVISTLITGLWITEVIAILCLGVTSLIAMDVHPMTIDGAIICSPTYLPRYAFLFWVPVIVFESFLFSLALRIAYRNYLEIGDWRGASLLFVVLRDNFIFFICAFGAYIITAATWVDAEPRYFTVPISFSCSLTTVMGCRLILNLCEAYHHPRDPDATPLLSIWAAATAGNIRFRSMPRASRAVTSGWPRWRRPQSQLTIDNPPSPTRASMGWLDGCTTDGVPSEEPGMFKMQDIDLVEGQVMVEEVAQ